MRGLHRLELDVIYRGPNTQHGRGSASTVPAWLAGVSVGAWVNLPSSTLSTSGVGWSGTPPGGSGNYQSIVTAWGGGVLNTVGCYYAGAFHAGTFVVIFGGGHADYAGNELYAYGPLQDDAPAWRRLTDPTIPAANNVSRISGQPVSRHSYDSLVYLPTVNKMLCIGVAGNYSSGNTFNVADLYDFAAASGQWSAADSGFPAYAGGGVGTINIVSGYDSSQGKAWGIGAGNSQLLGSYEDSTGTWASYSKDNPSSANNGKAAISSSLHLMVWGLGSSVYVQDLAAPNSSIYTPTTTGTPPTSSEIGTLEWDSAALVFVCVGATGTIFKLTPGANPAPGGDSWVWSSASATGDTPAAAVTNGTFGRFRFYQGDSAVPRSLVLMRRHDSPICFYRSA